MRVAFATASARTRPPCATGTIDGVSPNTNSVCPPARLSSISLLLRYGTCWPGIPVLSFNSSEQMVKIGDAVG